MARILTLNTGLAGFRLLGRQLYEAVPFVERRAAALAGALRPLAADVVCLQEIMHPAHKRALAAALADLYPHATVARDRAGALGSGLMVLSRVSLGPARVVPFRAGPPIEKIFSQRALLDCTLTLPDLGRCRIVNVHLTAGGVRADGMSARVEAFRRRQIDQLLAHAAAGPDPTLIVGDLNSGPEASAANFRQLLEGGFSDAFAEAGGTGGGITWDPGNPLNVGYVSLTPPPQRIDHVLLRADDPSPLRVAEAAVVLREPMVALAGRAPVSVSDHYGLMVRIVRK